MAKIIKNTISEYETEVKIISPTYNTGDIILVNFVNSIGHQQSGIKYAMVVSNNVGNKYSPMLEVLPATAKRSNSKQPTHALFKKGEIICLPESTVFEAEGKIPINKFQVVKKIGSLTNEQMERVAIAMVFATPFVYKAFMNGITNDKKFLSVLNAKN